MSGSSTRQSSISGSPSMSVSIGSGNQKSISSCSQHISHIEEPTVSGCRLGRLRRRLCVPVGYLVTVIVAPLTRFVNSFTWPQREHVTVSGGSRLPRTFPQASQ